MTDRIGMIGVGLLGAALAERLLTAGFVVIGHDRDGRRLASLEQLGGTKANSSEDVVRQCNRIVLSLPTSEVVAQVIGNVENHLRPGQIIIDSTTGEPAATASVGRRLSARNVQYLDATVSGSSEQARQGDIVLMVGGDAAAFATCRDLFDRLARRTFHIGPCGGGARVKLVSNLVLGLNRAALAEGLALAIRLGLDSAAVLEVLKESAAYARVMDTKGEKMIRGDFAPQARLSQHLKDVRLILAEGEAAMPLCRSVKCIVNCSKRPRRLATAKPTTVPFCEPSLILRNHPGLSVR